MAEYFTLQAIANRLGYRQVNSVYRLIDHVGFPAYQKFKPARWYTNDDLIRQWELTQANLARQKRAQQKEERKLKKLMKQQTMAPDEASQEQASQQQTISRPELADPKNT